MNEILTKTNKVRTKRYTFIHSSFIHNKICFSLSKTFFNQFCLCAAFLSSENRMSCLCTISIYKIVNGIWVSWKCTMYIEKKFGQQTFSTRTKLCLRSLYQLLFIIICNENTIAEHSSKDWCWKRIPLHWERIVQLIVEIRFERIFIRRLKNILLHRFVGAVATVAIIVCYIFFTGFSSALRLPITETAYDVNCEWWDKTGGYKSIHIRYRLATNESNSHTYNRHERLYYPRKWIEFAIRHTQRT